MAEDTLFDKILRKEIPADVVHEDGEVMAFRDINPQAPTHVLVVPKTKLESFADLADADPETIGRYMSAIAHVAKMLGLEEGGYRIVFNTGPQAQQSVQYIHAHILGGRQFTWPPG